MAKPMRAEGRIRKWTIKELVSSQRHLSKGWGRGRWESDRVNLPLHFLIFPQGGRLSLWHSLYKVDQFLHKKPENRKGQLKASKWKHSRLNWHTRISFWGYSKQLYHAWFDFSNWTNSLCLIASPNETFLTEWMNIYPNWSLNARQLGDTAATEANMILDCVTILI